MDKIVIQAYKHKPTGRLFHTEEDYLKFEEQYNKGKEKALARRERKRNWIKFISEPRLNAVSIDDFRLRYEKMVEQAYEDTNIIPKSMFYSFKFVSEIETSAMIYPISRPDCPSGSKLPGWEVIGGHYDASYHHPNPFNLNLDIWGHTGFHCRNGKMYLFLEDFPIIYSGVKDTWDQIVKLSLLRDEEEDKNYFYCGGLDQYVRTHPKVREAESTIESLRTQVKRIEETIGMCEDSLVNIQKEAKNEFLKDNPRDLEIPKRLSEQIEILKSNLKL